MRLPDKKREAEKSRRTEKMYLQMFDIKETVEKENPSLL